MLKRISAIPLFSIVILSLVLKLTLFCYIAPWEKQVEKEKILVSDSKGYQEVAQNLLNYHSFAPPKDTVSLTNVSASRAVGYIMLHPDGWMMPTYSVFLATVYSIAGVKPYVAIFIQILLSLISIILVYRISTLLFNNTAIATIASLLFALDIHSIYIANLLLTETLFVLFFLAGIYYFLKGMLQGKLTFFFVGAIFIALASLTRLVALLYPTILIFLLFIFSKQKIKFRLQAAMLYIVICTLMNGLWSFRNYTCYGHWQITTHGGWSLLLDNTSMTKERITHENIDSIRVAFQRQADSMGFRKSKDIFYQSEIYKKIAVGYITQHKEMYLLTHIEGGINMFLSLGNMGIAKTLGWSSNRPKDNFAVISPNRIAQNFSFGIRETILAIAIMLCLALQYIGAIYGIIKLSLTRNFMFLILLFLSAIYFAGITGVFGSYRFKLPLVPLICITAAYGYYSLMTRKQATKK